jgi:hypothetical protein
MSININGFDDLKDSLHDLQDDVESLDGKEISLQDLFNPEFLKKHSKAVSFDDFFKQGGFSVTCDNDLDNIPDDIINKYVSESTDFNTLNDMIEAATDEYLDEYLDLE